MSQTRNELEGYVGVVMKTNISYSLRRSTYDALTTAIRRCEAFFEAEDQYGANVFLVLRDSDGCSTVESVVEYTPQSIEANAEDQKINKLREALE